MTDVDRSPCRQCGGPIELVAQPGVPTMRDPDPRFVTVRVCRSLICPSNLNGSAQPAIA